MVVGTNDISGVKAYFQQLDVRPYNCLSRDGHHSSVDPSAHTILWPQVRNPSTASFFNGYSWNWYQGENKQKEAGIGTYSNNIAHEGKKMKIGVWGVPTPGDQKHLSVMLQINWANFCYLLANLMIAPSQILQLIRQNWRLPHLKIFQFTTEGQTGGRCMLWLQHFWIQKNCAFGRAQKSQKKRNYFRWRYPKPRHFRYNIFSVLLGDWCHAFSRMLWIMNYYLVPNLCFIDMSINILELKHIPSHQSLLPSTLFRKKSRVLPSSYQLQIGTCWLYYIHVTPYSLSFYVHLLQSLLLYCIFWNIWFWGKLCVTITHVRSN